MFVRTFGQGEGYARWETEVKALLEQMKKEARARDARRTSRAKTDDTHDDARLRELLVTMSRLPDSGLSVRV